jgi:RimJ/RimL family protein N-acetyltransferase
MTSFLNPLGQPIGKPLPNWSAPALPVREAMEGRFCRLEPLDPQRHTTELFSANALDVSGRSWTYLPYGPFGVLEDYRAWVEENSRTADPLFFAIIERAGGRAVGVASYLRIAPASGSIEVGHIHYSDRLQHTPAASEAMFLMMERVFARGYRRYEWKCDALNGHSRAAAKRLGFIYEGTFQQATIYKGRNRDTAWFSIVDHEWPRVRDAFQTWLAPGNFDEAGRQRSRLSELTRRSPELPEKDLQHG